MLLQVVDGTTIYFDGPPPKINEAPSLDNATPEAIAPTVSLARAPPFNTSLVRQDTSGATHAHVHAPSGLHIA